MVFGGNKLQVCLTFFPSLFPSRSAIDWFMDRLRTTLNVTGDAVVSGMVAHLTNSDDEVPDLDGDAVKEVGDEA